jgi:hypothetical protein
MADNVLVVEARLMDFVSAELNKIKRDVKSFSSSAQSESKKSSSAFDGITKSLKGLAAGYIGIQGVMKVIAFGKEATQAFLAQDEAVNKLSASLVAAGLDAEKITPHFEKLANEMQNQTRYGNELIISQMAYAKNLGITADNLEVATRAAIGLAAKLRVDLSTAMGLVAKASQGNTTMLSRYNIVIDQSLSKQEKFNEVLRLGGESFGLAEKDAQSYAGQLDQLKNKHGDQLKIIGRELIPMQIAWNEVMLAGVKLINRLMGHKEHKEDAKERTIEFLETELKKQQAIIDDAVKMFGPMETWSEQLKEALGHKMALASVEIGILTEDLKRLKEGVTDLSGEISVSSEGSKADLDDWAESYKLASAEIEKANDAIMESYDDMIESYKRAAAEMEKVNETIATNAEEMLDDYLESQQAAAKELLEIQGKLAADLESQKDLWRQAGAGLVGALMSGINSKEDKLRSVMKGLLNAGLGMMANYISGGALGAGASFLGGLLGGARFAGGTSFASGGAALVGERGPELVSLPRGSSVTTAERTRTVNNVSNTTNNPAVVVLNANDPNLADTIYSVVRNGSLDVRRLLAMGGIQR